jgi:hypothetical protein
MKRAKRHLVVDVLGEVRAVMRRLRRVEAYLTQRERHEAKLRKAEAEARSYEAMKEGHK